MTLLDSATLVISGGTYFTHATLGTAAPEDLASIPVGWGNLGHTDLEDVIAFASEGGEATTLGTLQKRTLRTTYSNRIDTFTFNLQQFDEASLKLYYGSNMGELVADSIWRTVPDNPAITVVAFLAVFTDGVKKFGIYAPAAEIYRADDAEFASDELAGLPIQIKPLNHSTNTWKVALTPLA